MHSLNPLNHLFINPIHQSAQNCKLVGQIALVAAVVTHFFNSMAIAAGTFNPVLTICSLTLAYFGYNFYQIGKNAEEITLTNLFTTVFSFAPESVARNILMKDTVLFDWYFDLNVAMRP